LIVLELILPF